MTAALENLDQELIDAARYGRAGEVRRLLARGADVHAQDDYALWAATVCGETKVVEILLAAGADVHADDDAALKAASFHGHRRIEVMLREAMDRTVKPQPSAAEADTPQPAARKTKAPPAPLRIAPQMRLDDLFKGKTPEAGTPLMQKAVWQNMAEVRKHLAKHQERLTTDHLRAKIPSGRMTYLQIAVKSGALDQVMEIAAESSQPLTAADLITPDKNGQTGFASIVARHQLDRIFKAELWVGRTPQLVELWNQIPAGHKEKNALKSELSRVSVLSMRQKMALCRETPETTAPLPQVYLASAYTRAPGPA
jgi:hypothetical protein